VTADPLFVSSEQIRQKLSTPHPVLRTTLLSKLICAQMLQCESFVAVRVILLRCDSVGEGIFHLRGKNLA